MISPIVRPEERLITSRVPKILLKPTCILHWRWAGDELASSVTYIFISNLTSSWQYTPEKDRPCPTEFVFWETQIYKQYIQRVQKSHPNMQDWDGNMKGGLQGLLEGPRTRRMGNITPPDLGRTILILHSTGPSVIPRLQRGSWPAGFGNRRGMCRGKTGSSWSHSERVKDGLVLSRF